MITNHRQPQPRLAAVYLLMPTSLNVDLILRDYAPSAQPEPTGKSSKRQVAPQTPQEPPKYAAAYVNFMEGEAVPLLSRARRQVKRLTARLPGRYQRCPRREIDGRPPGELPAGPERTLHQLPRSVPFAAAGRLTALLHMLIKDLSTALEPRLFTTRSPRSFFTLYAPPDGPPEHAVARWEDDIGWTARSVSRMHMLGRCFNLIFDGVD